MTLKHVPRELFFQSQVTIGVLLMGHLYIYHVSAAVDATAYGLK